MFQVRFICRISAVSNAIQTKDNEANHLIIYSLNCMRHGRNTTYELGLNYHSGLNNFCNMIVPLHPKHVIQRALKLPCISTHAFLTQQNCTNPSPCSQFFCAYKVSQSPHEKSMSGANTRSILTSFGDNN